MKLLRIAFLHGSAVALTMGAPGAAMAQARLAPPNPQQERCIESVADTKEEKGIRKAIGESPEEIVDSDKWDGLYAWLRQIAVFGSEKAAQAAQEKVRIVHAPIRAASEERARGPSSIAEPARGPPPPTRRRGKSCGASQACRHETRVRRHSGLCMTTIPVGRGRAGERMLGDNGRSVPEDHQERLAKDFRNDEQRREALALAKKYTEILWPRRIRGGQEPVCRLLPQFAGDPDPYGPDPSPR